jgi:integrase
MNTQVVGTITLSQALRLGLEFSSASAAHKTNQEAEIHKLVEFFTPRLGGDVTYTEFKRRHVHEFVEYLKGRELAPSTIRLAVNPLRLASRYMETMYELPALTIKDLPKRREPVKTWITVKQVVRLYQAAMALEWRDAAILCVLMGICGLRLTEASRLEPTDLRKGCLWVGVAGAKNDPSRRVIPIPEFACSALESYWDTGRELSPRRDVVGNQLRRLFRAFADDCEDPNETELFRKITPKDLRKTIPNELANVDRKWIAAYIGQTPKLMLERHYQATTPKPEMAEAVRQRAIADLRERVVAAVEKLLIV